MDKYTSDITNNLRDVNKKLNHQNLNLKEENLKLKEHIKVLEDNDYISDLEHSVKTLRELLEVEREMQANLKEDVKNLSSRLDEFLALFANYIDDENKIALELNGDKDLIFGVNIDSAFLKNSSLKIIQNYLSILKCNKIQSFIINDFSTTKKSDIILIGEVFADYVRLANIHSDFNVYGLVEISMPDVINPQSILLKFFGNKDVENEFEKFKQIYSQQLNFGVEL